MTTCLSNACLGHSIYCTPTHTDKYLQANSHHHLSQKICSYWSCSSSNLHLANHLYLRTTRSITTLLLVSPMFVWWPIVSVESLGSIRWKLSSEISHLLLVFKDSLNPCFCDADYIGGTGRWTISRVLACGFFLNLSYHVLTY